MDNRSNRFNNYLLSNEDILTTLFCPNFKKIQNLPKCDLYYLLEYEEMQILLPQVHIFESKIFT